MELTEDKVIALAGSPNVGKSTVFNALTGLNQHTGNWPGKTVTGARGRFVRGGQGWQLVDLPGTYSLLARSAEEQIAREFICFGGADAVVVVCDATALERSFTLILQTMEAAQRVVVCVNLMDEAQRKGIQLDLDLLSRRLGVPVVGSAARKKGGLESLLKALDDLEPQMERPEPPVNYPDKLEKVLEELIPWVERSVGAGINSRWVALRLLEGDTCLGDSLRAFLGRDISYPGELLSALSRVRGELDMGPEEISDLVASTLVGRGEELCRGVVACTDPGYARRDRQMDRLLTSRLTGYPVMMVLLLGVFWLTITGANYPSRLLADGLFWIQDRLTDLLLDLGAPQWLHGALVLGVYRVLAWVVSVMLPPMAIFFPLFTLLEDAGYLPRVAYNLDHAFQHCRACGKQALCMCMGFGCNAAGVIGCRIIDSPRERLLAILTNSLVPCNGRFPTLIAILTMFFVGTEGGVLASLRCAVLLTILILLGVGATFLSTRLLSGTVLKGMPSSFTLELPPYRRPQLGKVLVRSVLDRTLFVLGRAVCVAAPAGLVIWLLANSPGGDGTLLSLCAGKLDPLGRLMGLDGVILLAFVLGFPANEIVVPIMLMAYLSQGTLVELEDLGQLKQLLVSNGWTWVTAVSMLLFSLFHWPCSTTLLTIQKETGSLKWTVLAAAIPTALGIAVCLLFSWAARCFF